MYVLSRVFIMLIHSIYMYVYFQLEGSYGVGVLVEDKNITEGGEENQK